MRTLENVPAPKGVFRKAATGLYRFSTSGVYFAHVRIHGKLFRKSLKTTDREIAERKLADFRRNQSRVDHKLDYGFCPAKLLILGGNVEIVALCRR